MLLYDQPEVVPVVYTCCVANNVFDQLDSVRQVHLFVLVSDTRRLVRESFEEDAES